MDTSDRADSLRKVLSEDLSFIDTLPLTELSARKVFVLYYDALRMAADILALANDTKLIAHSDAQKLIAAHSGEEEARLFDICRRLRNDVQYYGSGIDVTQAEDLIGRMKEAIPRIIDHAR